MTPDPTGEPFADVPREMDALTTITGYVTLPAEDHAALLRLRDAAKEAVPWCRSCGGRNVTWEPDPDGRRIHPLLGEPIRPIPGSTCKSCAPLRAALAATEHIR